MGLVQRPDLPERIRRAFGLRESGVGATISPEIVPVAIVEDLTQPSIDEGYPRQCYCCFEAIQSAGTWSEAIIYNAPTSRVDMVFETLLIRRANTIGLIDVKLGEVAALTNLIGVQIRRCNLDFRVELRPNGRIDTRAQAVLQVTTATILQTSVLQNEAKFIPFPATLPPGRFILAVPAIVNEGIFFEAYWTERLLTTT